VALAAAVVLVAAALCLCPWTTFTSWTGMWGCWPWKWNVDLYTKALYLGNQYSLMLWQPPDTSAKYFPIGRIKPKRKLVKHDIEYALNLKIPVGDEEDLLTSSMQPGALTRFIEANLAKTLPMRDRFETFEDDEDPVAYVMRQFGSIYPAIYQDWSDKRSDRALARFCLHGLGAHRVDSVVEGGTRLFVVRADALAGLPVRDGFARYGGDAYFTESWAPVKIVDTGFGPARDDGPPEAVVTRPGDARWEEAKFRFRSSLTVLVTLVDHLYGSHLQTANFTVTAAQEHLSPSHPMRRFLLPFSYNAISVNDNAHHNLVSPGSLAPRVFAFTDHGLRMAFSAAPQLMMTGAEVPAEEGGPFFNRARYVRYLRERRGVDTEFHRQSAKLFNVMRKFAEDYMACYYPTPSAAYADSELMSMIRQVAWQMGHVAPAAPLESGPSVSGDAAYDMTLDLVADFMFTMTGLHEQVGAIEAYVQDVSFAATKWVPGRLVGTKQTASAQALLMSFTSLPMPKLLGSDWAHLFPAPPAGARAPAAVFAEFQASLGRLAEEADAYNSSAASRSFPENFPMYVMNPRVLETSASV